MSNSHSKEQPHPTPSLSPTDGGGSWKRRWKRLAIGLTVLFALLLIANGAYSWWLGRQLEQRLARLRAAGEPTSFAELAPKPIPPEDDAAVHLQRLAPELKTFEKEYVAFLYKTPLGESFRERRDRGEPPTTEEIAAIREILSHFPDLPQAIEDAANCEGYASQIDYTVADPQILEELLPYLGIRRTPYRFLCWKITVLLAEGKQKEALRTGLVILRLARHYNSEPAMVNGLVAIAVRGAAVESLNLILRAGPISGELRQELDLELALHDDPQWIEHVMKTERAINLSVSKSQFSQGWWIPWIDKGIRVDMIDYHERLLPVITQPWHKSHNQIQSLNTNVSHSNYMSRIMLTLLTPAIEAAHVSFNRNTAQLRCLRIVNALTAYAQENGKEAKGLDDLDLPDKVKLDPFSGKPLKLKWTDNGWVVYTVFKNETDDDGDFENQADWGLGPAGYPN